MASMPPWVPPPRARPSSCRAGALSHLDRPGPRPARRILYCRGTGEALFMSYYYPLSKDAFTSTDQSDLTAPSQETPSLPTPPGH